MISGHRRMHAAVIAGLATIPAIVRELSDDDAVIAMVDANIQVGSYAYHSDFRLFCFIGKFDIC